MELKLTKEQVEIYLANGNPNIITNSDLMAIDWLAYAAEVERLNKLVAGIERAIKELESHKPSVIYVPYAVSIIRKHIQEQK